MISQEEFAMMAAAWQDVQPKTHRDRATRKECFRKGYEAALASREELLAFIADATEYAGSLAMGDGWTPARKARSKSVYEAGRDILRRTPQ